MVHVWKPYSHGKESDHQGSSTNCIILSLWKKLEHIFSNPCKIMKSPYLPKALTISFYYYNMKLKLCDMNVENDKVVQKDYVD